MYKISYIQLTLEVKLTSINEVDALYVLKITAV